MDKELSEVILKSGNRLVFEVRNILKSLKWETQVSVYYNDDVTNKPREIDIIAKKDFPVFQDSPEPKLKVIFSIECKYIDKDFAFWTEDNGFAEARRSIITSGFNIDEMINYNNLAEKHHYFNRKIVAKLFDSTEKEKGSNSQLIYDAITQPIKALVYIKSSQNEIDNILYYPITVYSGKGGVHEINEMADLGHLDKLPKGDDYQIFSCNYSYRNSSNKNETRQFYVDLITKDKLKDFVITIEEGEIELTREFLRGRHKNLKFGH